MRRTMPDSAPDGAQTAAGATLAAAAVSTGLMAGLFYAFDVSVMPGLARTDDRGFVTAMQRINTEIQNPLFAATFVGALLAPAAAAVLSWRAGNRRAARWAAAGVVGYGVALALTFRTQLPLNRRLAASARGHSEADLRLVRDAFERRWVSTNAQRTVATTVALTCITRALMSHGRRDVPGGR